MTSNYFETGEADAEIPRDWRGEKDGRQDDWAGGQPEGGDEEESPAGKPAGFREYGKSKDSRDDLPQVVIGLAVTQEGIPVRVWCWPGNTADSALIRQVEKDMRDWSLGRVIWVADRGFTSGQNRRFPQQGAGAYIIGEKLRLGSAAAQAALSRQGRYKTVAGNLQVKKVRLHRRRRPVHHLLQPGPGRPRRRRPRQDDHRAGGDDRRVGQAHRGEAGRAAGEDLHDAGAEPVPAHHPGGLLRADKAKAKAEENLHDKYLLRSADPHLSAEDIVADYKQLLEVERGWRNMKFVLDLRRSTTGSKNASAPTSCSAGSRSCSSPSPRTRPGSAGPPGAASCSASASAPSPARPAPSGSAPTSPRPPATCSRPRNRRLTQDPRAQHARELIRALHDEPPRRDTARG